ncbi:N-acetylmuramidase family protein [Desulfovibrio sp. OttesenSCG-928-C06]|nr:N-acetylmuramidase family protein [Desulfovibrio sp. OttesenSCG-928-C06]
MNKSVISWSDIVVAAADLEVEPCAISAVCQVESSGSGFLGSGLPKILFEGHIFWRELKKHGEDPEKYASAHGSILYPKWTRAHYRGGNAEYDRLEEACAIHRCAALKSASWGTFQIMGFNHKSCGYNNVEDFVEAHRNYANEHLFAFCGLLHSNKWHYHLRNRDWASFAKCYNGPGYAENRYDVRLAKAYDECIGAQKKL